jgi:hypothetical protein
LSQLTSFQLTHPQDWQREIHYIQKILLGELSSYQIEKRMLQSSGDFTWTNFTATAIRDANNNILYLLAIVEDISQRKQAEAAMQLQTEREQLLGAITLRIRQSLKLTEILQITVDQLQQSLHTDRVLITHCPTHGSNEEPTQQAAGYL